MYYAKMAMQEVLEILKISKVFHETVHDRVELFYLKILVEIFPRPDDAHHWMLNLIGFPTCIMQRWQCKRI